MEFKQPTRPAPSAPLPPVHPSGKSTGLHYTPAPPAASTSPSVVSPPTAIVTAVRRRFAKMTIVLCVALVLLTGGAIWLIIARHDTPDTAEAASDALVENLEYQTVLPDGKTIGQLGGWKRVSPAKSAPVYAYADTIDGVAISVSQQPLPKSSPDAADPVADIANKFNATGTIAAGTATAYIGSSAKGPQSVILSKNSLLIMIKSQQKISDKAWAAYITSLN